MVRKLTASQLTKILSNVPKHMDAELQVSMHRAVAGVVQKGRDLANPNKPSIYKKVPYDTGAMQKAVYGRVKRQTVKGGTAIMGYIGIAQPDNPKMKGRNIYYPEFVAKGKGHNSTYGQRNIAYDAVRLRKVETRRILTEGVARALRRAAA